MSDVSVDKKKKRKINWTEYNESLVKREVLFDTKFFIELASRIKGDEQGKRKEQNISEFF